jgi:hypothetical protein
VYKRASIEKWVHIRDNPLPEQLSVRHILFAFAKKLGLIGGFRRKSQMDV